MKRIALIACCCFAFGCGEDPEGSGPAERAPDHLGISPGDEPPGADPDDGDDGDGDGEDDDSTAGAQDCGGAASEGEPGSSHKPITTRPLVPAAPGGVCTEGDDDP